MSQPNSPEFHSHKNKKTLSKEEELASSSFKKFINFFKTIFNVIWDIFLSLRILLFVVYVLTAILRFWIWFLEKALVTLRMLIRLITVPLGIASGFPYGAAFKADGNNFFFKSFWKYTYITILGEFLIEVRDTIILIKEGFYTYWDLTFIRKVVVLVVPLALVFAPLGFVIPRPEEVEIVAVNSIRDNVAMAGDASYVILAKGFDGPDDYRQYINKDAWWLTKVNSQRLKTVLKVGKKFQIWVVGYRIVFPFEMYPNMVYAVELDDNSMPLTDPSME